MAEEIKAATALKEANARAAALYEASRNDEQRLWGRLRRIEKKLEHLTRYENDAEMQRIVARFMQVAEDNRQAFKFFRHADAYFAQTKAEVRQLHVNIVCDQICDHDIKTVLENAERVAERKLVDWFISASVGHNYKHNVDAWLTYHLTFEGGPL